MRRKIDSYFPNHEEFMEEGGDNNDFPTVAEFEREKEKTNPWRDVEYNIPVKVLEINEIFTVNGNALIVKMQKGGNSIIKAWTTSLIKENLLKEQTCNRAKDIYLMSGGKKVAQKSKNGYRLQNNMKIETIKQIFILCAKRSRYILVRWLM